MGADVTFVVDASTARAFNSFQKLIDKQGESELAFKRQVSAADRFTKAIGGFGRQAQSFVAGFLGVSAVVGGVTTMFRSYVGTTRQVGEANLKVEKSLRELFSLNENAVNTAGIRQEVLTTSTAFAASVEAIVQSRFLAQSAIGGLSQDVQRAVTEQALLLSRLGTPVEDAVNGSASALLIYRDSLEQATDQGAMAREMIDKLVLTADLAKGSFRELSEFSPQVLAAGAARGFSMEESLSGIPTASAISGSFRVSQDALKNVINRLGKAEEELGITLQGSFPEQLAQVYEASGGDIKKFEKIFEQELSGFAFTLAKKSGEIGASLDQLNNVIAGTSRRKLAQVISDPVSFSAEVLDSFKSFNENIPALRAQDPSLRRQAILFEAAKSEAMFANPALTELTATAATAEQALSTDAGAFAAGGLRRLRGQLRAGGRDTEADALELQFGEVFGRYSRLGDKSYDVLSTVGRPDLTSGMASGRLFGRGNAVGGMTITEALPTGDPEAAAFLGLNAASAAGTLPDRFSRFAEAGSERGTDITRGEFMEILKETQKTNNSMANLVEELKQTARVQRDAAKVQEQAARRVEAAVKPGTARNGGL